MFYKDTIYFNSVVAMKIIRGADPIPYIFVPSVKNQENYIGTWYKTFIKTKLV